MITSLALVVLLTGHSSVAEQLTAPLNQGLKNLYPRTRVDIMSDRKTQTMVRTRGYAGLGPDIIFSWNRCTLVLTA